MTTISTEKLKEITGGNNTLSGPIINAIVSVITLIEDLGKDFGSSLRRMKEDNLCSLD